MPEICDPDGVEPKFQNGFGGRCRFAWLRGIDPRLLSGNPSG